MPIILERNEVIAKANALAEKKCWSNSVAACQALRDHFGLAVGDGIWGQSDAAICMGYRGRSEHEDLFLEIAGDVSRSMRREHVVSATQGA